MSTQLALTPEEWAIVESTWGDIVKEQAQLEKLSLVFEGVVSRIARLKGINLVDHKLNFDTQAFEPGNSVPGVVEQTISDPVAEEPVVVKNKKRAKLSLVNPKE